LALRTNLVFAGSTCLFSTNDPGLFETVSRWKAHREIGPEWDFEIRVVVNTLIVREAKASPQFRGLQQFVFAVFHARESFIFDLFERRVTAVVSRETAQDLEFWSFVFIPLALGILGPEIGIAPFRCATVTSGGNGMMIAGVPGAGKSALAVALAQEGFSFVSDEWTYARREPNGISVYGLHIPIKLLPGTSRMFEEFSALRPRMSVSGELAFEIDPVNTFGIRMEEHCVPTCVVFLERWAIPETSIESVPGESLRRFLIGSPELVPHQLHRANAERERIIEQLTDQECWMFRYGGTPQQGARALRRFFEDRYDADRLCATAS
jgi:hypothetical protein